MRVYIDGAAGATGLALEERLVNRTDINLLKPDESLRKDPATRRMLINEADVVFLCLPDDAAREAVGMVENPHTVIIDASTAHRTATDWAYGFPELSESHRKAVETSNRIAVPGCHASGFAALVYPLVKGGLISTDEILFCHSLTGYSGGGKQMIAAYEDNPSAPSAANLYALGLHHKHLPEMKHVSGLTHNPIFIPTLANVRRGMVVCVPLAQDAHTLWEYFSEYYQNAERLTVMPFMERETLDIEGMNNTDRMELYVFGHAEQAVLAARFDNLGKGSSGAALQCMEARFSL